MKVRAISDWLDETGESIQEDEFFLKKEDHPGLYSKAFQLFAAAKELQMDEKKSDKLFAEPIEQLSPKGIALISALYAKKDGNEKQPVIASTKEAFKKIVKMMDDESVPIGTAVTVIFQPTDMTNPIHKTVCKFEKQASGLNVVHIEGTANDTYGNTCFDLVAEALQDNAHENNRTRTEFEFYMQQHLTNPHGYSFIAQEFDKMPDKEKLDNRTALGLLPFLIKFKEDVWIYGLDPNGNTILTRSSHPEIYQKIQFQSKNKRIEMKATPEIYEDIELNKAHFHPPAKITKFSRQNDTYQCGTLAIKDARELNHAKLLNTAESEFMILDKKRNIYALPAKYLKSIQSREFSNFVLPKHGEEVVTRKGATLKQVHEKHYISGYVQHFSQKFHDWVSKFLEDNKENHKAIIQMVEQYDADKMTSERLLEVYGPKKNNELQRAQSTTSLFLAGIGRLTVTEGGNKNENKENIAQAVPLENVQSVPSSASDENQNKDRKISGRMK